MWWGGVWKLQRVASALQRLRRQRHPVPGGTGTFTSATTVWLLAGVSRRRCARR